MFKKALMKMSVIGIIGAAFAACGVVDVEQAQGVVDLRARILEYRPMRLIRLLSRSMLSKSKWPRLKLK